MQKNKFDAIVIGSGVGGMKVLVVEKSPYLGTIGTESATALAREATTMILAQSR